MTLITLVLELRMAVIRDITEISTSTHQTNLGNQWMHYEDSSQKVLYLLLQCATEIQSKFLRQRKASLSFLQN